MYTASLIAGVIASVMVVVLSLLTKRNHIIVFSIVLCVITGTQYALLGEYSTVVLSAITILYGLATFFERRFPVIQSKGFLWGLLAVYTLAFFISNGLSFGVDFMAYGASILGTVVMMLHNQISAKTVMLISGLLWLAFQLAVGAYGQIPGEIFYTAGCVYTLVVLFKRRKRDRADEVSVEDTVRGDLRVKPAADTPAAVRAIA